MYIISDVVEMGNAHEHILSLIKPIPVYDDADPETAEPEDYFDD